ncbi:hypothetical protein SNE40_007487 [Patella caerulea]|uniref:Protein BANP n=1 Tax=Patella caerulea TaxID=87958 RepID=A0AAN8Q2E4_PATCE
MADSGMNQATVVTAGNPNIQIVSIESSHVVSQFEDGNSLSDADINIADGSGEPPIKRFKMENEPESEIDMDQSLKIVLFNINRAICLRLDGIEKKLDSLDQKTKYLQNRVDQLMNDTQNKTTNSNYHNIRKGAVIVGLPQNGKAPAEVISETVTNTDNVQSLGPNVTLITLNSESDYPNGCWLGDENNPEMRVRVPISKSDLLHIHSNCRTSEKMALTLLDYLFDRDTQANSNLSGMGRHGKKQLDPLMIYGIRCHLIHRFNVTEGDWHRIKQNIDSKCRTAFRRRQRGQPLTVKAFRGKAGTSTVGNEHITINSQDQGYSDEDSLSHDDSVSELHIHQGDVDIQQAVSMHDGLGQGEIQILHATPEQISQLQQAHHIQILQGDQVIGQLQSGDMTSLADGIQVATVTTESGEVLHIQQTSNSSQAVVTEATTESELQE